MKSRIHRKQLILAFFCLFAFSCSKLQDDDQQGQANFTKQKVERGTEKEITLHLGGNDIRSLLASPLPLSPLLDQGLDSLLYGIKISRRATGEDLYEPYLTGLFSTKATEGDNIRFRGYNLEEYKIEATLFKNQTSEKELYRFSNNKGKITFLNPLNGALLNEFIEKEDDQLYPADYRSTMFIPTLDKDKALEFNHGELERFYGEIVDFRPDESIESDTLTIDLYRVSFGLNFEILGKTLKEDQRVRIAVNMGESPEGDKNNEIYTYTLNENTKKLNKIIAHGSIDESLRQTFYSSMFNDKDFSEYFPTTAYLETLSESGLIIESIVIAKAPLRVTRNRRTTYQIDIPEFLNDVILKFRIIDKVWEDEILPFPKNPKQS